MGIKAKLEDLERQVWSSELYVRQEASSELLTILSECTDDVFDGNSFNWDSMCGGLVRWISGSNYKISLVALKAISLIAFRMENDFAPTVNSLLPAIIDRLGDSKDTVRKEAASLIQVLINYVTTPKALFDEILPKVMIHKNAKVRESLLLCISETLRNFGPSELSISKMLPELLKLTSDSNEGVRDQSVETLCDLYKSVGESLRSDILRRREALPFQKEKMIIQKFDELLSAGVVHDSLPPNRTPSDESLNSEDKSKGARLAKSTSSGTLNKRTMPLKKSASSHKKGGGLAAGGDNALLTEDNLDESMKDYTTVNIGSPKELTDFCAACAEELENKDDWEKRIVALKRLRGLMYSGVDHFKHFKITVNGMSRAIEHCIRDLRSQVVREACITVSAMSTEMGNDFGVLAEKLILPLFSQLLINVKVMNVSAHICLRRIFTCTQHTKMLPILTDQVLKSKSAMVRKRAAEYIELVLQVWDLPLINKNMTILENSIKSGINDADSETRIFSRKSFWLFNEHFPKNAENMMKTFDTSKKKMLQETKLGKSSATGSSTLKRAKKLAPGSSATLPKPPTMSKSTPDLSQLGKTSTLPRQPKTPARIQGAPRSSASTSAVTEKTRGVVKSKSTVMSPSVSSRTPDSGGIKKSKSGVMRSKQLGVTPSPARQKRAASSEALDRSRFGSPFSSPLGSPYLGSRIRPPGTHLSSATQARSGSGVRRSVSAKAVNHIVTNNNSNSETRSATLRRANRGSPNRSTPAVGGGGARTTNTAPRTSAIRKSASANLNQDSLASAFGRGTIPRMTSQDSIASSTDSSSQDVDIHEIVRASESTSWKIREEAVHKLKNRINEERGFNSRERKVVLQLFENLLNDNHAKILGLTMDVLDEFLALYRTNLTDWGCTVLAKAFYLQAMKQTQSNMDRVLRLLDTIHRSFPFDIQLSWCFTILDSRQANTNAKMKSMLYDFMSCTIGVMDPMEFIQTKESTIGVKVLLASSTDPKAPEIRKKSAELIATMFRHSPPVFSSILNTLTEGEQGQCVVLLQEHVPDMLSQENEVLQGYPGYTKIDQRSATSEESASLFDAINQRFGSSPGSFTYDLDAENINPEVLNSPVTKMNITPSPIKNNMSPVKINMSPVKINMSPVKINNMSPVKNNEQRDRSLTAELQAVANIHLNTTNGASAAGPPLLSTSSLNGSVPENNAIFAVLEALLGGTSEEKSAALLEALNLLKEDGMVNDENAYDLLSGIMNCTEDEDSELVSKALKVLNKFLVYQPEYMAPHCEEVVTKIVRAKCQMQHVDSEVLYQLLVMVYKTDAIIKLMIPMLQNETYPVLLAVINLLYSTLKQNTPESQPVLEAHLPGLTAAVNPACSHVETNVRKQSIFCLVELLLIFGTEKIDNLLESLTVSQKKLVYLYFNRHQRNVR